MSKKNSSDVDGSTVGKILKFSFRIFPAVVNISPKNKAILKEDLRIFPPVLLVTSLELLGVWKCVAQITLKKFFILFKWKTINLILTF